ANDVKIQVEFNPAEVASYRLVGYGNRLMAAKDFNDDTKDAGEIGAGHSVTAFYEIVPRNGQQQPAAGKNQVDDLKYQKTSPDLTREANNGDLLTLKVRYKLPDEQQSHLLSYTAKDADKPFHQASADFQFASAVAAFGMLLRNSKYAGEATYTTILELAAGGLGKHQDTYRKQFVDLVRTAQRLSGH
ncbi:MAG: DUF3520 domain-containing protein, partial [Planctomycetales bacterium]